MQPPQLPVWDSESTCSKRSSTQARCLHFRQSKLPWIWKLRCLFTFTPPLNIVSHTIFFPILGLGCNALHSTVNGAIQHSTSFWSGAQFWLARKNRGRFYIAAGLYVFTNYIQRVLVNMARSNRNREHWCFVCAWRKKKQAKLILSKENIKFRGAWEEI